ncbi:MAG: ABC transporter ATP-binding protein [Cyclobacteriaceae bacterium]
MLQTQNLNFAYTPAVQFNFPDIHLHAGERLLITGLSGAGKTTFLHLISGLLPYKSGKVFIDKQNISAFSRQALDKFRGQNIGFIFQKPYLIHSLSVLQNLYFQRHISGFVKDPLRATTLLEKLGIAYTAHKKPYQLSQGEQQRVTIALALQNQPKLIIADEPTASLDDINCTAVMELLHTEALALNAALVVASHDARIKSLFTREVQL